MLEAVMAVVPVEKLAVHFHDTYGQSLSNILVSLQVSSSIGNLVEDICKIFMLAFYMSESKYTSNCMSYYLSI